MSLFVSLSSSHSARTSSSTLRSSVRSDVRKRFLASCCVSVEPPSAKRPALEIGIGRARHAERVEADVLVEAPVLGGEHRVRHALWQEVERHVVPRRAALGEHAAVAREDADHRPAAGRRPHRQGIREGQRVVDEHGADAGCSHAQRQDRCQENELDVEWNSSRAVVVRGIVMSPAGRRRVQCRHIRRHDAAPASLPGLGLKSPRPSGSSLDARNTSAAAVSPQPSRRLESDCLRPR